jgi:hypothetical protein
MNKGRVSTRAICNLNVSNVWRCATFDGHVQISFQYHLSLGSTARAEEHSIYQSARLALENMSSASARG